MNTKKSVPSLSDLSQYREKANQERIRLIVIYTSAVLLAGILTGILLYYDVSEPAVWLLCGMLFTVLLEKYPTPMQDIFQEKVEEYLKTEECNKVANPEDSER
jgi:hypothetical protein